MSGNYEQTIGTGRRPAPTDEELEKMAASMLGGEVFSGNALCPHLCHGLQMASDELQELETAIGQGPVSPQDANKIRELIARMRAINTQMRSLSCPLCEII